MRSRKRLATRSLVPISVVSKVWRDAMRRVFLYTAILVALLPALASAQEPPTASGVILYFENQGSLFLLHADHTGDSDRGWGTFGGMIEPGETPRQAAVRELLEETRCVFNETTAARLVAGSDSVMAGDYVAYVVEVPYVPVYLFESLDLPQGCQSNIYLERGPYAWIPLAEILRVLSLGESGEEMIIHPGMLPRGAHPHLWKRSAEVVRLALEAGLFPTGE